MKIFRGVLFALVMLVIALVLVLAARIYYLHWGGVDQDDNPSNVLSHTKDNLYFIPGSPLRFEVTAYQRADTTFPLNIAVKPYFCQEEIRCFHSWLTPIAEPRQWNEYRITTIEYIPFANGSSIMPNLAQQQTVVELAYYDEGKLIPSLCEASGIMDDPLYLFIHPPRSGPFAILEICPMPTLNFPICTDTNYVSHLEMPGNMVPKPYRSRYPDGMTMSESSRIYANGADPDFPEVKDLFLVRMDGTSPDQYIRTRTDMLFSPTFGPLKFVFNAPDHRIVLERRATDLPGTTSFMP